MSSIRIVQVPPSDFAPQHVREQWLELELPLATPEELRENPPSNVRIGSSNIGGYIVLRSKAVEALRSAGKENAADFWDTPMFGTYLQFSKEVCALLN